MNNFKTTGQLHVDRRTLRQAQSDFASWCASEQQVKDTIKTYSDKYEYVLDPHTACGVAAADQLRRQLGWPRYQKHTMVVLGTAHPAKFGSAVCEAIGRQPDMPPALGRAQTAKT